MKMILISLAILTIASGVSAQHAHESSSSPASIIAGLGEVNHPVSTKNAEAQRFFNQGLALALWLQSRRGSAKLQARGRA